MPCILEELGAEKTSALLKFLPSWRKKLLFGELFRRRTETEVKLIRKHFVDVHKNSVFAYRFKGLLTFPKFYGSSLKREAGQQHKASR